MKKRTKYIVGFLSFLLFCIIGIGIYYFGLYLLEQNKPFLTIGPDSVRESTAAMLYMFFSFLITGSILFVIQVYNNTISFITLINYLNNINNQEAVKFLARLLWLSGIDWRNYAGNEYLIHRIFYPQAALLQKGRKIWALKIKYKQIELVLTNKIGKLIYYNEKILCNLIIKRNFSKFDEIILLMRNFLYANFQSDLTDAQINNNLDEIFLTEL
jgi:hypothetical protein